MAKQRNLRTRVVVRGSKNSNDPPRLAALHRMENAMSKRPQGAPKVQLLARCVRLAQASVELAKQAHAAGTARRLRRALRTARSDYRAAARRTRQRHAAKNCVGSVRGRSFW